MRGVAERTRVEASAEGAAVWQHELRQYGHALQKPMNFQPTRMMFYCEGRPIVVQWTLSLFGVVQLCEGFVILRGVSVSLATNTSETCEIASFPGTLAKINVPRFLS